MPRRRDFTSQKQPIEFTIDADTFHAPVSIPAPVLFDLLKMQNRLPQITEMEPEEAFNLLGEMIRLLLAPDSAERFMERLYSRTEPLDLAEQVMPIIAWLVEEYTGRPLPPASPSPNSSNSDGTSSTDGAPAAELTLSTFPAIAP